MYERAQSAERGEAGSVNGALPKRVTGSQSALRGLSGAGYGPP